MVKKIKKTKTEKQAKSQKLAEQIANEPKVFLTGAQVVKKCESKIIEIYIPAWKQYIRGKVPTPKVIKELRLKHKNSEAFNDALFRATLIDFADKDFDALEESNGLRYLELMTAVLENADLFGNALKEKNIKK